jgi:hypothetical protein
MRCSEALADGQRQSVAVAIVASRALVVELGSLGGVNRSRMTKLLLILGITLLLGGFGHSIGVTRLYATAGRPDANRILLDVWVAEAQLLGGGLFVAAARSARNGVAWRALAAFGSLTTIGFTVAMLPVLFSRAPVIFRVAPIIYLLISIVILAGLLGPKRQRSKQDDNAA